MKPNANLRPILFLMVASAALAEILSGSTPLRQFVTPRTFLFLSLGYGIPVLMIREYGVRRRLSAGGIFWLGLGYGIVNEGFLAKTLLMSRNVPNPAFDAYGMWFGINWSWTLTICLWHSAFSTLLPITITHYFFPSQSSSAWLSRKMILLLLVPSAFMCCANFLGKLRMHGTPEQMIILLGLIGLTIAIGSKLHSSPRPSITTAIPVAPFILGWCILPAYILLSVIAVRKLPFPVFPIAYGLILYGFIRSLKTHDWLAPRALLVFGCGAYMQSALTALFIRLTFHSFIPDTILAEGAALILFYLWQRKLRIPPIKLQSWNTPAEI